MQYNRVRFIQQQFIIINRGINGWKQSQKIKKTARYDNR